MGLDMHLKRETYIGGHYDHAEATGGLDVTYHKGQENEKHIKIDAKTISSVTEHVYYWRKANQIHHFFTNGEEDDRRVEVSSDKVRELIEVCKKVIASLEKQKIEDVVVKDWTGKDVTVKTYPNTDLAMELLPPSEGFFFGSNVIDEYYLEDLKDTVEELDGKIEDGYYIYNASY